MLTILFVQYHRGRKILVVPRAEQLMPSRVHLQKNKTGSMEWVHITGQAKPINL